MEQQLTAAALSTCAEYSCCVNAASYLYLHVHSQTIKVIIIEYLACWPIMPHLASACACMPQHEPTHLHNVQATT
jgi:hypothetical protein